MKKSLALAALTLAVTCMLASCGGQPEQNPPAHTHSFSEWEIAKNPTCTYKGISERFCDCGEIQSKDIPALGHSIVIDEAKEPTCTSVGLTEGKHCSTCKKVISAQTEIAMLEHTYSSDFDATCNGCDFTRDIDCSHTNVTILPAKGATCTEDGATEGMICDRCELILQPQTTIAAKGHTAVTDPATAATCTEDGLTEGKRCSICDAVIVEQKRIAALGHNNSDWIVEKTPTETEDGYRYKTCYRCGSKTEEVVIPALTDIGLAYEIYGLSVTITGIGSFSGTELIIPEYIKGYKVTVIGEKAFYKCENLTKIVLPDTITNILTHAFYGCTGITEITIPESVSSIGTQIFYKASNLATVYYNGTYDSQENHFLKLSHITKIVFGGRYVPNYICNNNTAVKTVEILDSVKSINSYAFSGCTGITEIAIPDSVTYIGDYAFRHCSSLTSVVIPNSVTSIGERVFDGCSSLENVVIPDSVTRIDQYAFQDCSSLTSVVISDSVTRIYSSAFRYCFSLTEIKVDSNNANYKDIDGNLYTKDGKTLIQYAIGKTDASFTIPDSVTWIDDYAFRDCSSLESVVIPDSVISIGEKAFYSCDRLTSVVIPDSVAGIGPSAFRWCSSLTSIKYRGTESQWNAMFKGSDWDSNTGDYTITYNYDGE